MPTIMKKQMSTMTTLMKKQMSTMTPTALTPFYLDPSAKPMRPIGTPYIEKSKPYIQTIRPVTDPKLAYSVVIRSPLDL